MSDDQSFATVGLYYFYRTSNHDSREDAADQIEACTKGSTVFWLTYCT